MIEGKVTGENLKVAIITARFNEIVTDKLHQGAVSTLLRHGVSQENITEIAVPGAFELPGVAAQIASKVDAVILLGAVIRGSTPHFDQVVSGTTSGSMSVNLESGKPVILGVLTTDTVEQALNRAGLKAGNKGSEAAVTAIEMANLYQSLK